MLTEGFDRRAFLEPDFEFGAGCGWAGLFFVLLIVACGGLGCA